MGLSKYEKILPLKDINEATLMFDKDEKLIVKFLDYLVDVKTFYEGGIDEIKRFDREV